MTQKWWTGGVAWGELRRIELRRVWQMVGQGDEEGRCRPPHQESNSDVLWFHE